MRTATGVQIALVTIPSLQGEPIEDVANTLYRAWGVGQKGKNEGILLLLAIGDRRNKLEIFALSSSGNYKSVRKSRILPGLDIGLVERCVAIQNWTQPRASPGKARRSPPV